MKDVLLDTNILIGHLNGDARATDVLLKTDCIRISVMSEYELLAGLTGKRKDQQQSALELLQTAVIYPVTSSIAKLAAEYCVEYGGKKTVDRMIAATLRDQGLKALVTFNADDFPMVKTITP